MIMTTPIIFIAVLSCFLIMFTISHSFTLSDKNIDDEHQLLIEQNPSAVLPNQLISIYPDDDSLMGNFDEHNLEKRRFNAWAGKRNLVSKRRFYSWAG